MLKDHLSQPIPQAINHHRQQAFCWPWSMEQFVPWDRCRTPWVCGLWTRRRQSHGSERDRNWGYKPLIKGIMDYNGLYSTEWGLGRMDCQKKHLWCFGQEAEAKAQAMCKAIRQALRRWKGMFFFNGPIHPPKNETNVGCLWTLTLNNNSIWTWDCC